MGKKIGVIAKTPSKDAIVVAKRVYRLLVDRSLTPVLEQNLAKSLRLQGGRSVKAMNVDLMITLGGDGTVLKTVREMPDNKTPILAVNLGRRGYLTEVEPDLDKFEESFDKWLKGDFQIEEHWRVSVSQNGRHLADCLNEALLLPGTLDKMVNVSVDQNGHRVIKARADGFMVATPTGSTAHSFSAGGPVLETSLDVLVLTMIAPLQPVRSLVVPANKKLTVTLEEPGPTAMLIIDGTPIKPIGLKQSIELRKSARNTRFVRFGDTFLQRGLVRLSSERENA